MARAIPPQPWLLRLDAAVHVAHEGSDPEGVHQIRVACRRLMTWLDLGRRRIGRDDLKWLRDGAARVRDLDVQRARSVPAGMEPWLEGEWETARPALVALLDDARTAGTIDLLRNGEKLDRLVAEAELGRLVGRARAAAKKVIEGAHDVEDLHRVRRRIRPVRFGLEWLGRDAEALEDAQGALGLLGDAVVGHRLAQEWRGDATHIALLETQIATSSQVAIQDMKALDRVLEELS